MIINEHTNPEDFSRTWHVTFSSQEMDRGITLLETLKTLGADVGHLKNSPQISHKLLLLAIVAEVVEREQETTKE